MSRFWRSALVVLGVSILVAACSNAEQTPPSAGAPQAAQLQQTQALPLEVSVQEARALQEAGAFVLDVREPFEWEAVRIPGATLIPLGQLAQRVNEVPRDRPVVVICRSGNRSQEGRDILRRAGFTQVTSMRGGLRQWAAAGFPVVSGP
ncbi:MAG: rhodanese-like domain-containing protein [Thermoflexales bacterium]|nr:rhodanese-like domain-containing protein [Thermoflexales bacterium]MCX7939935.1 rhodanese-like domain-containing protein [Thermoflexales bacterium]MDW8054977.1 rhodanese-like domain-containing protein [Anaerolineae bacterium]MDW8293547.1 rhodanese-like domain-containing protein [Anaerolineae bacterium]